VTMTSGERIGVEQLPESFLRQVDRQKSSPRSGLRLPGMTLEELEREAILRTYEAVGNVKSTAELLDVSERKIYYRLDAYRDQGFLADQADEAPASSPTDAGVDSAESAPDFPRLVLAEDDRHLRWALQKMLEKNYEVVAVANGRALIEESRAHRPDVILSDIRMPGLDGIQMLREIHNEKWDIPIVLISAYGDQDTRAQAELLGARALLDKPLDLQALRRELRQAVGG